ncbi:hypothetical protein MUO79_08960 [Candidatus Bathyarchaeota archaeon]|nr:hypothetical protein [Candidatus Bathyarchaeota archaeon]
MSRESTSDKKEETLSPDEVRKLLDWFYDRELVWIVFGATCFIALIELLPEIRYYGSSFSGGFLTSLVACIASVFVFGFIF